MRANNVRTIWENGGAVINGWLHIPSSWSAEVMAHLDWDSLTIDMQHGIADLNTVFHMMQAISTTDTPPLVRVPWNIPDTIQRVLDLGAYGIICPMINSRAECEAFVGACRYHPDGYRSSGPIRARMYGGPDYMDKANETIITMAMIETREAMNNLDDILSTPGLDAIYIGPSDLSLSLFGHASVESEKPEFVEALRTIFAAAQKHGIYIGIHTGSVEFAQWCIAEGAQFVTMMSDTALMTSGTQPVLAAMKGAMPRPQKKTDAY
jgi:4-hydroxy-2-oxoheptanedioate aldolase